MNIQNIIIYVVFAAAIFYIGKKLWNMMNVKQKHEGCNKCDASEKIISDKK